MSTGFVLNIPDTMLEKLKETDKHISSLAEKSNEAQKGVVAAFKSMADNGVGYFIEKLKEAGGLIDSVGTMSKNLDFGKNISQSATKAIDDVVELVKSIEKIQTVDQKRTNSAITQINLEIEEAIKRLGVLRERLNFYAIGEGQKAIGFVDTSAYEDEAESLMKTITLLEEKRRLLIEESKVRLSAAMKQEEIDNAWFAMERQRDARIKQNAAFASEQAKQSSKAYEEAYEEQLRAYEKLWDKAEKIASDKDTKIYENWLRQKDREKRESEKAENEKFKAQQKAAMEAFKAEQERLDKLAQIRRQNEAAKTSGEEAKWGYERTISMYAQMFDEIERNRKESIDRQNANEFAEYQSLLARIKQLQKEQGEAKAILDAPAGSLGESETEQRNLATKQYRGIEEELEKSLRRREALEKKHGDSLESIRRQSYSSDIRDMQKAEEDKRRVLEETLRKQRSTYEGSLDFSRNADSVVKMAQAVRFLEAARDELSTTDVNYTQKVKALNDEIKRQKAEIDKVRNGAKELQKEHRSLMDISGQLARKLALVFSVSQITGYVKKLIEVRGEFELQQRSLQAILQNKDEANRIWQQTVDLAVRSPFRVKELVSYTKQLAAYRIESDKLFETNKMLADISAGLGVDMQRLILAFGQVRSAAYLRGTELRQFTEAGIPILEQLAQYFTELEGRAVSVGDVFERVSKRMVSFADVEEIFRRMTSEGGTFYRMQEIQAETLKGMWSNLKDSVDLMLNEIGKANEGTLKSSIQSVKELVDGWRDLAFAIKLVLVPLGTYFTITSGIRFANNAFSQGLLMMAMNFKTTSNWLIKAEKGIVGFVTKMGLGKTASAGFAKALGGLASLGVAGIIAGIVVGLVALITKLTSASRAAKQLNKDLQAIYNEDTSNLKTQVRSFESLVGRLKDVNKGSREHEEIISQLNSQYGEYLGFIVDEKTTYDQLASSIDSVTLALTRKAKMNTFEKAYSKTLESTNKQIAELEDRITKQAFKEGMTVDEGKTPLVPTQEEIDDIFGLIEKKVRETGKTITSYEQLNEIVSEYYGKDVEVAGTAIKNFTDITDYYLQQKEAELELDKKINDVYGDRLRSSAEARKAFADLEERQAKALKDAEKEPKWVKEDIRNQFAKEKIDLEVKYEGLDEATAELRKKTLDSMSATIKDINKKIEDSVPKLGEKYANIIYVDENEASKGVNQIAESTAAAYKAQKEIIKQQTSLKKAGTAYDKEILDNAQKTADAYYYKLQLLGRLDLLQKETTKEETKEMKLLRQQLAALKEAGQTYQSLRQDFDKETATQKTASAFKDLFAELKMTDLTKGMSFDELGILKVLEELPNKAGDAGKKAIEKLRAEFLSERDVEAQRDRSKLLLDAIQEEFDRYNLSLELKKLNIPPDLAKSLFDVDYLDLEGLKKAVQDRSAEFIGTDMEDEYKKFLEKIDDMEDKDAKERMKTYVKYLQEGMSERVKLKIEELRKLKEIEESDEFTPAQKARIKANVSKEARAKQQAQEWKDFQGSEMYTMMFEDLEFLGTKALDVLKSKLEELKGSLKDLPASEVKEIIGQISKIEDIAIQRNPFTSLRDAMKEVRELEAKGRTEEMLQTTLADADAKRKSYQEELDAINLVLNAKDKEGLLNEVSEEWMEKYGLYLGMQTDELEKQALAYDALASGQEMVATNASNDLEAYADARKAVKAVADQWETFKQLADSAWSSAKQIMESLGVESDSLAITIGDAAMNMVDLVFQAIMFDVQLKALTLQATALGIQMNAALGPIGWIVLALQAVATVLSAIFSAKDKALQKEIDGHLARAEKLHEKYEELSDAIDSAYDASVVKQFNKEIEKTIKLEIKAIEAAIAAEKAQKASKIDWDWVDEQEKAVKDLYRALNEEHDNYIERWGGFGSEEARFDFIESMTQAWLDSFKETGDGLAGLEEKWDEYFDNLAMKQMALRVSKAAIDKYLDMWDKYVSAESAGGEDLTEAEAQDLRLKKEQLLKDLSEKYTSLAESLGITPTTEGSGLSALSKSIQGVSESTAQVLESLLSSMRFYVADSNAKLTQLLNNMMGGETESPMLAELRAQTKWMRDIYNLINGMTATHPSGGRGIKTVM